MSGTTPAASAPAVREAVTPSIVRTVTPIIVGAVLTYVFGVEAGWLRSLADSFGLTEGAISTGLTLVVTAVLSSVYYPVVRYLEVNVRPSLGALLGVARQPIYARLRDQAADRIRRDNGQTDPLYLIVIVVVVVILIILLTRIL